VILASSEGHGDDFILVPEEQLTHITNWAGEPVRDLLRADMIYFDLPEGGSVFSVGSITFCGSLLENGCDNNVSHILRNIVRQMAT
jgi:N,N-dimethylformamidase